MSRRRLLPPLAAAVLLLAGCSPKERVIDVAVAVPLTGDMGTEGRGVRNAVELALDQANAARRFPYRLELLALDDRNDPKLAVSVANLIASDPRVAGVVGHYTSGCALAAAPVYARSAIPMLTPSATNPELTRAQLSKAWAGARVVFRLVADDEAQGAFAAKFVAHRLGKRRVAVLHDGTAYAEGLAARFKLSFAAEGGRVVADQAFTPGQKDFSEAIDRIRRADSVFFAGVYTDAGTFLKRLRGAGLKQPFVSGDGAHTLELMDVAGRAADGAYATMPVPPVERLPGAAQFVAAYKARFPGEELKPFDHAAYEAAQLLLDAMAAAGPDASRERILAALRASRRQGLLGRLSFDEKGDVSGARVLMTRAVASERKFVAAD
jgi:branched-chain amino acid transport system substrate-binding protein